jgi:hypothetical protein
MSNKQKAASSGDCSLKTKCKRNTSFVPFILPIDEGYRISADDRCWRMQAVVACAPVAFD